MYVNESSRIKVTYFVFSKYTHNNSFSPNICLHSKVSVGKYLVFT